MNWSLRDAKNHFPKIVRLARSDGPQVVTVHDEPAAIVLSVADYDALLSGRRTFVDDLLSGPSWDAVDARPKTPSRSPTV